MTPAIIVEGPRLSIAFGPGFDLDAYDLFLRVKGLPERDVAYDWRADTYTVTAPARFAAALGADVSPLERTPTPIAPHLFDYQRFIVERALDAKRYAIWADTGLGKTAMFLEWARQVALITGGRVLIMSPLQIIEQTREEWGRFYGDHFPIERIDSRDELAAWCMGTGHPAGRYWRLTKDGDPDALALYERHYSARQYADGRKRRLFVGPGEKLVLLSHDGRALFAWRKFRSGDGQTGINCSVFRREGGDDLASDMIREAMEFAWHRWPGERLYTYVAPDKIGSPNPGYCFKRAAWQDCGETKGGHGRPKQRILEAHPTRIGIVNPEKMIPGQLPELRLLAGLVIDESSLLKTGGGTIKWNLIHSAKGIEYKLSCTATPAPNDTMEYASQAAFLEVLRSEGDIIWTYFSRDPKTQEWRVKPHAKDAFYRFMSSWSIYLRDPAHYGFADILSSLPPPEIREHPLPMLPDQRERMQALQVETGSGLFADKIGIRERAKFSQLAKGFIYGADKRVERVPSVKPERVVDLVLDHLAAGRPTIVWTVFDAESDIVLEALGRRLKGSGPVAALHGSDKPEARQATIDAFKAGEVDVLVTKAALVGHGLNFQNCRAMVFSGFDDSFERLYQAIRRAYRFGQTETVHVDIPYIPELEGLVFGNVKSKEAAFLRDVEIAERNYRIVLMAEAA